MDERILVDLATLKKEMREVKDCLLGDKVSGKVGVMELTEKLWADLYGDATRHHLGYVLKLEEIHKDLKQLQRNHEAVRWMAIGWAGAVSLIMSVIAYWVKHLIR